MTQDDFLTTAELLDYLQVNLQTVHRLIKSGQIPPVRVGREWLFRRRDIDGWVESSRKVGSPARAQDGLGERPCVLVVDDDSAVRELLLKALTTAGYLVDVAIDGPSALTRLTEKSYDLMITDLKMPGQDGLSLIREARITSPGLPVIVITGYSSEATAIEAINLGVSGYLTKPFRLPRILAATARALGEPIAVAEA
ncbi:MAG: response regulator [Vicinamibacterales bacterium]